MPSFGFVYTLVFLSRFTLGECARPNEDFSDIDVAGRSSMSYATNATKSYMAVTALHVHGGHHQHANTSHALVPTSSSSRGRFQALYEQGELAATAGGKWSPAEVMLLVVNMMGDVFGAANAGFTAAQQIVSMTVPKEVFKDMGDKIGVAFGSGFGVGTAGAAALLDATSLVAKFDKFKWNDRAFQPCVLLRRTTALIDIFFTFLSFCANVASVLGDNLMGIAPPVNLWLSAGGRIAGGVMWLLQTFMIPFLEASSCKAERAEIAAQYGDPTTAQTNVVNTVHSAACNSHHVEICKQKEDASPECTEDQLPKTDEMGTGCRPWSSARKVNCWNIEREKIAVKQDMCRAKNTAELQTNVMVTIDAAKTSAIELLGLTGDDSIFAATDIRGGGVGGSQLAGRRDLGPQRPPNNDETRQLKECCFLKGQCLNAATLQEEINPALGDILRTKCTRDVAVCFAGVTACGTTIAKDTYCTEAYFKDLKPCCPQHGAVARHCSEDLI